MYRGKIMVTAVAVFAIGAAFAAPTSTRADRLQGQSPATLFVDAGNERRDRGVRDERDSVGTAAAVSRIFDCRHAPGLPRRKPRGVPVV